MPASEFSSPALNAPPPGSEPEEMDMAIQLGQNATITNEGAEKLSMLLRYLAQFNDTISINDGHGRRVRVLGVEDVAGIGPIQEWWEMSHTSIANEKVEIDIHEGMCEGPGFNESEPSEDEHPIHNSAWGYKKVDGRVFTLSYGTTYFYVKATVSEVYRELFVTDSSSAYGKKVRSYSYNFKSFEIVKVSGGTQPTDTNTEKYKLLGIISVSDGEVVRTKSWWRTNHIFNWTFYTYIREVNA
tara:strand:- start:86 stop:811 length:726 start_codon:yes stop_codon:yes gene_type:complete